MSVWYIKPHASSMMLTGATQDKGSMPTALRDLPPYTRLNRIL